MPKAQIKQVTIEIELNIECDCGEKFTFNSEPGYNFLKCPKCFTDIVVDIQELEYPDILNISNEKEVIL